MLVHAGAPIVPPAEGIGNEVYRAEDRYVTFWRYEPQDNVAEASSEAVAQSLSALHAALAMLGGNIHSRTHKNQITDAIRALDRPAFAPELPKDARSHLRQALAEGLVTLSQAADDGHIIHGSPHRFNILVVAGSPRFIDFETVEHGPLEWDLAHLEPKVADYYPNDLNPEVLTCCRLMISALTSSWCWDGLNRGPDMRAHAEHHLAVVRSSLA
jgi:aminoglycoside phosphotransferase (APT) family kinase protein